MRKWWRALREKRDLSEVYLEACAEVFQLRRQAERLTKEMERDRVAFYTERRKLQRDNAALMEWNAGFAMENSELAFQLQQIRGDA